MKTILIFFIFLLSVTFFGIAQKTLVNFSDERDLVPFSIVEAENGDLYTVGRYTDKAIESTNEGPSADTIKGFIMKFNASGDLLNSNFLELPGEFRDLSLLENGEIIAVGGLSGIAGDAMNFNRMKVFKFSSDLELLWSKTYLESDFPAVFNKIVKVKEDEFWCFGSSFIPRPAAYTMLKINANGDSLDFKIRYFGDPDALKGPDIIYDAFYDDEKCYVLYKNTPNMGDYDFAIDIYKDFQTLADSLPGTYMGTNIPLGTPSVINGMAYHDSTIFLNAKYRFSLTYEGETFPPLDRPFLVKTDIPSKNTSLANVLKDEEMYATVDISPGGMTKNEERLFLAINYNRLDGVWLDVFEHPNDSSRIILKELDFSGNIINQEVHDEGAFDVCRSIISSKDNSILALGSRFVHSDEEKRTRDLIIVKFFDVLGYQEENDFSAKQIINLYPNPNNGIFKIDGDFNLKQYEMYTLNGMLIKSSTIENNTVDARDISPGMYLFKLEGVQNPKKIVVQ